MVGRDELGEVTVIYPMTVGRKPRAERPEEEQQEAGNRLMRSRSSHGAMIIADRQSSVKLILVRTPRSDRAAPHAASDPYAVLDSAMAKVCHGEIPAAPGPFACSSVFTGVSTVPTHERG